MIRAFAIALAVATMRLIFIPAFIVVADPTQGQLQTLSAAAFLVAFVVHVSVAEAWIRLTQRRDAHGTADRKSSTRQRRTADDANGKGVAVILRVWSAKINPARLEAYRRFEAERCMPMLHKQPGLLGVASLLARPRSLSVYEYQY